MIEPEGLEYVEAFNCDSFPPDSPLEAHCGGEPVVLKSLLGRIALQLERRREAKKKPTAMKVRRLVPKCLLCNADTVAHRFAQLASIPINEETKPGVLALFSHVKDHEWELLKGFTDFRGDQDDAIVYCVTGPHAGGIVVLIRDPADLYSRVEIYLEEIVTPEELERIKALVPSDAWQELPR
jgi:hypothetical protein